MKYRIIGEDIVMEAGSVCVKSSDCEMRLVNRDSD
jgi:hypothetical protein